MSYLTDNEVLFFFNVIAIMGQMKPQFKFKHGNSGGEKVIARLTLWGYLVVAEPTSDSVRAAEVIACRQALEKMQEQNSKWVVPPLPTDGPTGPGWIWTKLLKGKSFTSINTR